jgi:protein O-GlcNAc transferase
VTDIARFITELPILFDNMYSPDQQVRDPGIFPSIIEKCYHQMCTVSNMAILNLAVRCMDEGEAYVEVGVFRGESLIGALYNTGREGWGVDNFSQFVEAAGYSILEENIKAFAMEQFIHFFQEDYEVFLQEHSPFPIGVYYYDGHHGSEETFIGLQLAWPKMSQNSLIFLDDYSFGEVQIGINKFIGIHSREVRVLYSFPCLTHPDKNWWNGWVCLEVKKIVEDV